MRIVAIIESVICFLFDILLPSFNGWIISFVNTVEPALMIEAWLDITIPSIAIIKCLIAGLGESQKDANQCQNGKKLDWEKVY